MTDTLRRVQAYKRVYNTRAKAAQFQRKVVRHIIQNPNIKKAVK